MVDCGIEGEEKQNVEETAETSVFIFVWEVFRYCCTAQFGSKTQEKRERGTCYIL